MLMGNKSMCSLPHGVEFTVYCQMLRYLTFTALLLSPLVQAESPLNYDALSIERAVQIALEHNQDSRLSAFAVDSAKAARLIAGAAPNPLLTVQTFNINPQHGIGSGNFTEKTVDTTVRLDQLIERGNKRKLRVEVATGLESAAGNDNRDVRRQLRISISQAYYDVLAAQQRLEIIRDTYELYDKTIVAAQKRVRAGDIANADLMRLQVDAQRARNDVTQAQADALAARQYLALGLGQVSAAAQINLTDSWPAQAFNASQPDDNMTRQRPDILAAQARLDAALAARKLARALLSRDVSVGLQFEHWPTSQANQQGTGDSLGVAVQVPLFVRYAYAGEQRAAEVGVLAAEVSLEKAREQARNEITSSWVQARTAYERVQRYDEGLLIAAKKSVEAAEFAYRNGALGVMDILDARRTYRATQLDAVGARDDYAKALVAWTAAISENIKP